MIDESILVSGNPFPRRNEHFATLTKDPDDEDDSRIIMIIGGWLGTGPLASSDMHVLDMYIAGQCLCWYSIILSSRAHHQNPAICTWPMMSLHTRCVCFLKWQWTHSIFEWFGIG
jgi:hypothetical protein